MTADTTPQGVLAIWTDPEGRVIATHADFERSAPGGFDLHDAQRMRATDAVRPGVVQAYCSPIVAKALRTHTVYSIIDDLLRAGHRLTFRVIGYPDDIAREVEER